MSKDRVDLGHSFPNSDGLRSLFQTILNLPISLFRGLRAIIRTVFYGKSYIGRDFFTFLDFDRFFPMVFTPVLGTLKIKTA